MAAIVLRALTFGSPVVHVDEEFYVATAHAMLHGAVPYIDIWDRKPVGLFLLYCLPLSLGLPLGIWAYQAMALASVTVTATVIARLADRAGWAKGALMAGLSYVLWLDFLAGAGGQTPVFYNSLMVGAAALVAPRDDDGERAGRRFAYGLAAFALVGLALQIKYSVVFEGVFFGLWWVWREWRLGRPAWLALALGVPLAVLALVPTLAAWGWYAVRGWSDAFVYANFVSIGHRVPDTPIEQSENLAVIVLLISPLLAFLWMSTKLPHASGSGAGMRAWLSAWTIAAILALLVFGSYFDHYALPILVPLCACCARFFAGHRDARRVTLILSPFLLIGAETLLLVKLRGNGNPTQLRAIGSAIDVGRPGCLYVYSGPPMSYPASKRCTLTRYRFPDHLTRVRERGAIGVAQAAEIARIMAARPEIVIVGPPFRGERPELRALIRRLLAKDYAARADLPLGNRRFSIYARR